MKSSATSAIQTRCEISLTVHRRFGCLALAGTMAFHRAPTVSRLRSAIASYVRLEHSACGRFGLNASDCGIGYMARKVLAIPRPHRRLLMYSYAWSDMAGPGGGSSESV